jgi:hypothetical protein
MLIQIPYIAYRFLKEALHRLVGIDRDASVPTTVFTLGVLGVAAAPVVAPVASALRRRPALPTFPTTVMALFTVRHLAREIGGEPLRSTPYSGAIITAAMFRPAIAILMLPVRLAEAALAAMGRVWRYVTVGMTSRSSR